jgi:Uncharacterized protein conserved in bacteria
MLSSVTLTMLLIVAAPEPSRVPIEGFWKNPIGSAIITIAPCGPALCGKVAWASERGRREAARGAPQVVGSEVLTDVTRTGDHWTGSLFIPDDNVHVSARLQVVGARQLKLTGCILAGLFCRTQVWTRFEGPLPASK